MTEKKRLILLVLLGWAGLAQAVELVNPGFDEPKSPDPSDYDQAAGWVRWGSWANRHDNLPEWPSRNGKGMVAYHHWLSDSPDAGWYQDVTNAVPGGYYRFSVWAQWEANCNAESVELSIEPFGGGEPYAAEKFGAKRINTTWTYITVHGRLPAHVTRARFVIRCHHGFGGALPDAQGAIKFDDAALTKVSLGGRR